VASSLLALLDDIATLLDDVSVLTKVATQKTAGVLGDDLALNAQQVAGLRADRELPIVWAVAKGSLLNKAILVPSALAISAFAPWAVMPLLMIGGAYLCYEGFEKLAHKFLYSPAQDDAHHAELVQARSDPRIDLVSAEKAKIKGAVAISHAGPLHRRYGRDVPGGRRHPRPWHSRATRLDRRPRRAPRHRRHASTHDFSPARCLRRRRGRCAGTGRREQRAARVASANGGPLATTGPQA
jgi:hypothetical protein